ncbi:MAG: amidohydrolase [Anaerolineaceae bacterium]|nr:amidohydrolase [Anaerolineaceae bacterium]
MQTKQDLIKWLDESKNQFAAIADFIWENPETAYKEFKSSKIQADFLAEKGFTITWDIGGINTAFIAEWGEGKPVIGFIGEYDALAGLSQKRKPSQESLQAGAPGHACGHNLLGTGALASAVAIKYWLAATGQGGTVRYYGCPAEEVLSGKTFMARDGVFDDLDAAFNFHPGSINSVSKASCVGLNDIKFRFHGISAHAGSSPHLGRSALDAVELMNVGSNYLREHVTSNVRIHYAITHGGDLPNVVPPEAEVWYFIRAHKPEEMEDVTNRVRDIAKGAALMTGTTFEEIFQGACSYVLSNHYLADLQYEAMKLIGPIQFSAEEIAFAQSINDEYPAEYLEDMLEGVKLPLEIQPDVEKMIDQPLWAENLPALDEGAIYTGSTDVGDVSQITPLSMINTACWPTAAPAHSWGVVAAVGTSMGHKGMLHAAKTMALAAIDLYTDPMHIKKAREEFEANTKDQPYKCPIPDHIQPPNYPNPERP